MQLFWLLFWLTIQKVEAHKKAIYGREIIHHAHSFVKSFAEIFQKIFSPHSVHNPETRRIFAFHSAGQKQGYFKLPPFAFALKMIFNLILKLNLKMNSNSKLVLNLIFKFDFEFENVSPLARSRVT